MGHESYHRTEEVVGSSNRSFGLVFAVVFAIIALLPLFHGGGVRLWSLGVGALFAGLAFAAPQVLAPLNRLWLKLGLLLHKIVNPIVLGIMFYLVVTPTGLIMRLLGKDLLRLKRDPVVQSYWIERTPPGPKPESLGDQF
ncbi:MAG: SxtJ family membrane protein [Polyangiales bacterium]